MRQTPPLPRTASTISPRHRSTVSIAAITAGSEPVWPTMSGVAKLRTAKATSAPAVGTEVEEERHVVLRQARTAVQDHRLDELVRETSVVRGPHRGDRVVGVRAFARDDRLQRAIGALPAVVAIHRVVATDHGGD